MFVQFCLEREMTREKRGGEKGACPDHLDVWGKWHQQFWLMGSMLVTAARKVHLASQSESFLPRGSSHTSHSLSPISSVSQGAYDSIKKQRLKDRISVLQI